MTRTCNDILYTRTFMRKVWNKKTCLPSIYSYISVSFKICFVFVYEMVQREITYIQHTFKILKTAPLRNTLFSVNDCLKS